MADDQSKQPQTNSDNQQYDEIYSDVNVDDLSLVGMDTADYIAATLPDEDPEIQKILDAHTNKTTKAENTATKSNVPNTNSTNLDIGDISAYIAATKEKHTQKQSLLKASDGTDLTELSNIYAVLPHAKGDHKLIYLEGDAPQGLLSDPKQRTKGQPYVKNGETIYEVKTTFKKHPTLKNSKNEPLDVWVVSSPTELQDQISAIENGKGGGTNFSNPQIINEPSETTTQEKTIEVPQTPTTEETPSQNTEIEKTDTLKSETTLSESPTPTSSNTTIDDNTPTVNTETPPTQPIDSETNEKSTKKEEVSPTKDTIEKTEEKTAADITEASASPFATWQYKQHADNATTEQESEAEDPLPQVTEPEEKSSIGLSEDILQQQQLTEEETVPDSYTEEKDEDGEIGITIEQPAPDIEEKTSDDSGENKVSEQKEILPTNEQSSEEEQETVEVLDIRKPVGNRSGGFSLSKEEPKKIQEEPADIPRSVGKSGMFRGLDDKPETPHKEELSTPTITPAQTSGSFIHDPEEVKELQEEEPTEQVAELPQEPEIKEQDTTQKGSAEMPNKEKDTIIPEEIVPENTETVEPTQTKEDTGGDTKSNEQLPEHAEKIQEVTTEESPETPELQEETPHAVIDLDTIQPETTQPTSSKTEKPTTKSRKKKVRPVTIIIKVVLLVVVLTVSRLIVKIMWSSSGVDPLENTNQGDTNTIIDNQDNTTQQDDTTNNTDNADDQSIVDGLEDIPDEIDTQQPQQFTLVELTNKLKAQELEARKLSNKAKLVRNQEAIKFSLAALIRAGNALEKIETDSTVTADEILAEAEAIDTYLLAIENLLE